MRAGPRQARLAECGRVALLVAGVALVSLLTGLIISGVSLVLIGLLLG